MMYKLKHNKKDVELTISNFNISNSRELQDDEVGYWNECIWIATNRKILREEAQEILKKWIKETEVQLEKLKNLKIKTKY